MSFFKDSRFYIHFSIMFSSIPRLRTKLRLPLIVVLTIIISICICSAEFTSSESVLSNEKQHFYTNWKDLPQAVKEFSHHQDERPSSIVNSTLIDRAGGERDFTGNGSITLDDLVNSFFEGIRPKELEQSSNNMKRDVVNQSSPSTLASETDDLFYDEQQDLANRHIQYDVVSSNLDQLVIDQERGEKLSRYMLGNETNLEMNETTLNTGSNQRGTAGRAITGLPKLLSHISKPPYATNDQFNHRSANIADGLPKINTRKDNFVYESASNNSVKSLDQKPGPENKTPTDVSSRSNSSSKTDLAKNSSQRDSVESLYNKQELEKLALANKQPVELSPIPTAIITDDAISGHQTVTDISPALNSRSPSRDTDRGNLMGDLNEMRMMYAAASNNNNQLSYFPGSGRQDFESSPTEVANSIQDFVGQDLIQTSMRHNDSGSIQLAHNARPAKDMDEIIEHPNNAVTRKTLEVVSNQLQQSDQNWPTERQTTMSIIQQPTRTDHYVSASLINVTAPILPPISATEAMEISLGEQSARDLLSQVSGLVRPSGTLHKSQQGGYQAMNVDQQQQHLYGQAIYSRPANQFNPQKSFRPTIPPSDDYSSAAYRDQEPGVGNNSTSTSQDRRLDGYNLAARRPTIVQPAVQPSQPASGFRSPMSSGTSQAGSQQTGASFWQSTNSPYLSNYLNLPSMGQQQAAPEASIVSTSAGSILSSGGGTSNATTSTATTTTTTTISANITAPSSLSNQVSTTNGFITNGNGSGGFNMASTSESPLINHFSTTTTPATTTSVSVGSSSPSPFVTSTQTSLANGNSVSLNRRVFNLTRVEHISAECSNDLIRTVIVFNGTFKGIIYSSGYVRDSSCIYVNGTGKTRYDFSIRLNQCGTLGRQELHPAAKDNDLRRRDQIMWNTLSIQYNPIIEQEWDEHFRVSCEYGSDFWKTISFSPFNVETNTGSPVVFTVDPPQCQMEILRGHGMVGPRQESISGPVTVGDPLTLLIHMKSERPGYDILVKNCIAHNGGHQKMQLIDSNGCVVNERFISPFRGTYNDNDLKHITLHAYLKAFRFTGSPVLYLECEIHMCQSSCPPQMCYWRRLSKRSASTNETDQLDNVTLPMNLTSLKEVGGPRRGRLLRNNMEEPKQTDGQLSDKLSLWQALEVLQEREPDRRAPYSLQQQNNQLDLPEESSPNLMCYRRIEILAFLFTIGSILLVTISVSVGCCLQKANKLRRLKEGSTRLFIESASASASSSSLISSATSHHPHPVSNSVGHKTRYFHNKHPHLMDHDSITSLFNQSKHLQYDLSIPPYHSSPITNNSVYKNDTTRQQNKEYSMNHQ